MKKITSSVTYTVPNWNFCNVDRFDLGARVPKETCSFCVKTRDGHRCMLYDASLTSDNGLINKTRRCCEATAGFKSSIDTTASTPSIPPSELIKQTIELYSKTVNDLIKQGYPRSIAETAAKKHILEG